jgi:DNA primase
MNSTKANSIHTIEIINGLNIPFIKSGRGFLSRVPHRTDKNPSLYMVDNRWKDLGTGEHGRTLDLVIRIYKCSVSDALRHIKSIIGHHPNIDFSFYQQVKIQYQPETQITIKKIQGLQNIALISYMESRGIDYYTAKPYCSEIYLSVKGKNYFYIAFRNDQNGYELRNRYMKSCLSSKAITTITGQEDLWVFEGFMDYLSALILWPEVKRNSVIVMNSVANISKTIEKIETLSSPRIELFLDNDKAGDEATAKIIYSFPKSIDRRILFQPYKDVNEYIQNQNKNE